ncbi:MAG: NADH-quinone oxidoreductase subunit D, partial [Candidatus Calescibacterium sp.]|nr:NADH-quinone oxidoreductase subunit D [Candidatus Calescibacterium sp.]
MVDEKSLSFWISKEDTLATEDGIEIKEMWVAMGPQHPSTHGILQLLVKLDGEIILELKPVIGYLHRSMERIAESLTYVQGVHITDRQDYISAMNMNLPICLAVDELLGIIPSRKAQALRTLAVELNRLASHLLWYGLIALDAGAVTPFLWAFELRENILAIFEKLVGARLTLHYIRPSGVAYDIADSTLNDVRDFLVLLKRKLPDLHGILTENPIFISRMEDVGYIPQDLALSYGASGPVLRAAGVRWDLRRSEPYLLYDEIDFEVPVETASDNMARYLIRMKEIEETIKILEQVVKILEDPFVKNQPHIDIRIGWKINIPAGQVYVKTEAPRGEYG